jgi:hypothetical protein
MKIALYIEDGLEQIVLTPENLLEEGIVGKLGDSSREMSIYHGGFYACQGGWIRHSFGSPYSQRSRDEKSTIIVLRPKPLPSPIPEPGPVDDPAELRPTDAS